MGKSVLIEIHSNKQGLYAAENYITINVTNLSAQFATLIRVISFRLCQFSLPTELRGIL